MFRWSYTVVQKIIEMRIYECQVLFKIEDSAVAASRPKSHIKSLNFVLEF